MKVVRSFFKASLLTGLAFTLCLSAQTLFADDTTGVPADSFEYHGYARTGLAFTGNFLQPGSNYEVDEHWLGRLGYEGSQSYVEPELVYKHSAGDGTWTKYHLDYAFSSWNTYGTWDQAGTSGTASNGYQSTSFALRQVFVEMGGFSWDPKATYWVGERYNCRDDMHILDWYWRNNNGTGVGVNDAANGLFDFAILSGNSAEYTLANGSTPIPVNANLYIRTPLKGLDLEGNVDYQSGADIGTVSTSNSRTGIAYTPATDWGVQGAVVYSPDRFFAVTDGYSRLAVQAGLGNSATDATLGNADNGASVQKASAWAFRAIIYGMGSVTPQIDVFPEAYVTVVNSGIAGEDTAAKVSAVVRPVYKFTKQLSLQVEGGVAHQFSNNSNTGWSGTSVGTSGLVPTGVTGTNYKVTVAPTLSLDSGFWGRPQLRAYMTYVGGDSATGFSGVGTTTNNKDSSELLYGVQAEIWF